VSDLGNENAAIVATGVPLFVRRLRRLLPQPDALDEALCARGIEIVGDSAANEAPVDCVLLTPSQAETGRLCEVLAAAADSLDARGVVFVCFPDGQRPPELSRCFTEAGLEEYEARAPREASRYTIVDSHQKAEDPARGLGVMAYRCGYDPLEHARALAKSGCAAEAFDVLDHMPENSLTEPTTQLIVALEMQLALLGMALHQSPQERLRLFFWAQQQFYRTLVLRPTFEGAYTVQAEFWRLIGDTDMARRLLRSIEHLHPSGHSGKRLATLGRVEFAPLARHDLPQWNPSFRPRILMLTHTNSDCGADTLYDGLCEVIGAQNVCEYPWKATFHGHQLDAWLRHPNACNHPGEIQEITAIEAQLREGRFDVILFADTLELSNREDTLRLVNASPKTPLVVVDVQDEGHDTLPRVKKYLRREDIRGYFKREMLNCTLYAPHTQPLPLAYPDRLAASQFNPRRSRDLFWAGHCHWGLRWLYVHHLEEDLQCRFDTFYSPDEFATRLDESRIGLDIFGLGYDTVRHYELPAHGCMLLTEGKPIYIPFDFEDGVSAVFFDDLPELREKARYYIDHPDEACAIAERGFRHYKEFHTSTARARQFLGCLQEVLREEA